MADELLRPFVGDGVGRQDKAPAIPADMDARDNFRRENLPEYLDAMTTVENLAPPEASVQAVMDGGTEPYDMSALEDLLLTVDDYEGRKNAPGTPGITVSGSGPAESVATGVDDDITVNLHGETEVFGVHGITLGTQATPAAIAAAIQAGVRGLTASAGTPENQQAYDGFTCEYVPPSISTTLAEEIPVAPAKTRVIKVADIAGIKLGDVLEVADQSGGPLAPFDVTVIDIRRFPKELVVESLSPAEAVEVGALVRKRDDFYRLTSGKRGNESQVAVTAGTNDGSALLKLTVATGAVEGLGKDAIGQQRIPFVAGDFVAVGPAAATAAEAAVAINKVLTGAIAEDNSGDLRITSRKFGASANIKAAEGVSQAALGLPTDIEEGTQTDITLSIRNATILSIQKIATATPGDYVSTSAVRVEGDKLVNVDGTDHTGGGVTAWRVTYSPRRG
jgi:hypothetical protein